MELFKIKRPHLRKEVTGSSTTSMSKMSNTRIDKIEDDINNLKSKESDTEFNMSNLESDITTLNDDADDTHEIILDIMNELEMVYTTVDGKPLLISHGRIDNIESDINSLQNSLQSSIYLLQTKVTSLESQVWSIQNTLRFR